jgi:hypothetical protein
MRLRSVLGAAAALLLLTAALVACGDDDDSATTTEADGDGTTTSTAGDANDELCALAQELSEQDGFPTAAQLKRYTELAPPEIADLVAVAGPPLIEANGDSVAVFTAIADDEVEAAINEIDAWESENCGVEHQPINEEQAAIDPDASRVDVTASEYTFAFPTELTTGPSSFVLTNAGAEVHFMVLTQLAEGRTIEEVLAFDGDPEEAGLVTGVEFESGLAAPGGDDEEIITTDLAPGSWAMLCFIPGPDGTPHAFSGMAVPFTVT